MKCFVASAAEILAAQRAIERAGEGGVESGQRRRDLRIRWQGNDQKWGVSDFSAADGDRESHGFPGRRAQQCIEGWAAVPNSNSLGRELLSRQYVQGL